MFNVSVAYEIVLLYLILDRKQIPKNAQIEYLLCRKLK